MNRLQNIDPKKYGNVFVTMNPIKEPESSTVQGEWEYEHPGYTLEV